MNRFSLCFALSTLLLTMSCRSPRAGRLSEENVVYSQPTSTTSRSLREEILAAGKKEYREHATRQLKAGNNSYFTSSQNVSERGLLTARLLLHMKKGALLMSPGSEELLNAYFKYPAEEEAPNMLSLTSGTDRHIEVIGGGRDQDWQFDLSPQVPLAVLIESEGGYRQLHFDDIPLREFALQANGGVTDLSILGEQPFLASSHVSQGRGSIAMNFSGTYDVLSAVKADTAAGDISAVFAGYYNRLAKISIETICGDVELDLTGAWRRICRIEITCTDGDCTLFIPRGLGATLFFRTECGRVISPCLQKKWSSNSYINNAFEKTKEFLDISVMTTAGNVYVYETTCSVD
ncbi:MAG: hypothetical protein JSR80_05650 [Verrucomicrobia bacterium]|nr:hypothetical protein [Verrucomicrobiota bacterium]